MAKDIDGKRIPKALEGAIMSKEEELAMRQYEKERFGHVLERDINGDPVDEDKLPQ